MIPKLKNILATLDEYIGHYPIYLYLLDKEFTLVWFNRYMAEQQPELKVGQKLYCLRGINPCGEPCPECRELEKQFQRGDMHKSLIRTRSQEADVFIEFFNLPVYDDNGRIEGLMRIGMDVTENETLQAQLREKEKLFTAIVDTSTDAIIFLDNEDRIQNWNKGAEEIFGYSAGEIIGKPVQILVPQDLIELGELNYFHEELNKKGFLKKYETQRLHKDGRLIYVDISSTRIYDESGQPVGTSEIIKDIDSRKELEFELLRTILELSKLNELNEILHGTYDEEEILRIILIAITAGEGLRFNRAFLLLIDKKAGKLRGHLAIGPSDEEEANRIWSALNQDYRYLKDIAQMYEIDLEGADKKVNEIVHDIEVPLDHENHILIQSLTKKRVFQVKEGKLLGSQKFKFDIGDTDLFTLLKNDTFIIAPLFSKKEPLGLIIADNCINKRDISTEDIEGLKLFANQASSAIENARLYRTLERRIQDLQEAYRQLEDNQAKLLRAERLAAIGEMSAKVAHEIRNPLVSIGGFARLIEKRLPEDSPIKKYASIIRDQIDNLEYILNNILSVANPPKPEKKLVQLHEIVHQVMQVMRSAFRERNITVNIRLNDMGVSILGDERLLHQALLNLLKNSIEALEGRPVGGVVEISTRVENDRVYLRVWDNGPGIEETMIDKIFKKFFTTKSKGTGLGLSIVSQVVESHGGEIEVKSGPEQGAAFVLHFPIAGQAEAPAPEEEADSPDQPSPELPAPEGV